MPNDSYQIVQRLWIYCNVLGDDGVSYGDYMMNLYLHGIGNQESPIIVGDCLASDRVDRFNMVMTNPPFGKTSSITIMSEEGKADREESVL